MEPLQPPALTGVGGKLGHSPQVSLAPTRSYFYSITQGGDSGWGGGSWAGLFLVHSEFRVRRGQGCPTLKGFAMK